MGFSTDVSEKVLVDCGRSCAICHKFCGIKLELHHIVQAADGGKDTYENCIPLCFDCHSDVKSYNPHHPKGKKYTESELKEHRDRWYKSVATSPALCSNDDYIEVDKLVYLKLKKLIKDDVMNYIRNMDFGGWSYGINQFDDLNIFCEKCLDPLLQFIDADLEKSKMDFRGSLKKMFNTIGKYCNCEGEICMIPRDWELERPDLFEQAVEELNEFSLDVWNKYYSFISLIKRKLII